MVRYTIDGRSRYKCRQDTKGELVAWEEVKALLKVIHDQAVPGIDDDGLRLIAISDMCGAQLESSIISKEMLFDLAYKKAVVQSRRK
jgi:hypothetical protein